MSICRGDHVDKVLLSDSKASQTRPQTKKIKICRKWDQKYQEKSEWGRWKHERMKTCINQEKRKKKKEGSVLLGYHIGRTPTIAIYSLRWFILLSEIIQFSNDNLAEHKHCQLGTKEKKKKQFVDIQYTKPTTQTTTNPTHTSKTSFGTKKKRN